MWPLYDRQILMMAVGALIGVAAVVYCVACWLAGAEPVNSPPLPD